MWVGSRLTDYTREEELMLDDQWGGGGKGDIWEDDTHVGERKVYS